MSLAQLHHVEAPESAHQEDMQTQSETEDWAKARSLSTSLISKKMGDGHEVPYRAEMEQSIGSDFGGVRAHTGPKAKDACAAMGAEAFAVGNDVAFFDDTPSKGVVAHELAHTLQQGGGGGGAQRVQAKSDTGGGGDLETEADAVADHVIFGRPGPARELISSGGADRRVQMRKGAVAEKFKAWAKRRGWDTTTGEAEAGQLELSRAHEVRTFSDKDTLSEEERKATEKKSVTFDWKNLSVGGADTYEVTKGQLEYDGSTDAIVEQLEKGVDRVDADRVRLGQEMTAVLKEETDTANSLVDLDKELQATPDDPALLARKAKLKAAQTKLDRRKRLIQTEIEFNDIVEKEIKGQIKDFREGTGNPKAVLDRAQKTARKYSQRSLKKQSTIWSIDTKGITWGTKNLESTKVQGGSIDQESSSTSSVTLGEGGTYTNKRSSGVTERDSAGNVVSSNTTERESSRGVVVKEDGTVGLKGGEKIKKALKNQHGRNAFAEAGANGSFTVNIIEIPDRTPPELAVVVTLSLGGEVGFGMDKEKTGKHGKGKVGVTAGASGSVEVTHTHVLSPAHTAQYLRDLEASSEGKDTQTMRPEFALLHRAWAGIMDSDDAAVAVQSMFGNTSAAAQMAPEESVEFTMKVGARAGASIGAEGKGGSKAGVEGGLSKEVYRSLKIARLPGEGKLMAVTVAFGGKDTMHGALTASGLGVSAKVGGKQWSSADEVVTFKLDADASDYEELYGEIVSCLTPSGLIAMRRSAKYQEHLIRFTQKQAEGGEESFEVGDAGGIAAFGSSRSHTRSHEITQEGDQFTVTDQGGSTDTAKLSLGGVDVLRHDRTETVMSENVYGRQFIQTGEETDDTEITWNLPGLGDVITAPSPKEALAKAMIAHRKRLVEYHLTDADLAVLVNRARDSGQWDLAAVGGPDYSAWVALRRQLVTPEITGDVAKIALHDPSVARAIARGAAMADFMRDSANGHGCMQKVLREWYDETGEDLGVMYEWPPSLRAEEAAFESVRRKVALVDIHLAQWKDDEDEGPAQGAVYINGLLEKIKAFEQKVMFATDFKHARAKIEMFDDFDRMRQRLVNERTKFFGRFQELTQDDVTRQGQENLERDRDASIRLFINCKIEEERLFARAKANFPSMQDDAFDALGTVFNLEMDTWSGRVDDIFHEIRELHVYWIKKIKQLRIVYKALETPEAERKVSSGPDDERTDYEPNAKKMQYFRDELRDHTTLGGYAAAGTHRSELKKYMSYEELAQLYKY